MNEVDMFMTLFKIGFWMVVVLVCCGALIGAYVDSVETPISKSGGCTRRNTTIPNPDTSDMEHYMPDPGQQFMQQQQLDAHQRFVDWSMDEGRKSVTPIDQGGYVDTSWQHTPDPTPTPDFNTGGGCDFGCGGFGMF